MGFRKGPPAGNLTQSKGKKRDRRNQSKILVKEVVDDPGEILSSSPGRHSLRRYFSIDYSKVGLL